MKISDKITPEELLETIDALNPSNIPGRLTIIVRMGADKVRDKLPTLIRAVQKEGRFVIWVSDPVHGNTIKTEDGIKTRPFTKIRDELRAFFDVHDQVRPCSGTLCTSLARRFPGNKRLALKI